MVFDQLRRIIPMKKISITTGALITLLLAAVSGLGQTQSRAEMLNEIEAKRQELSVLENRFLSASKEDQATYADFLRQPDTGLIRLLPREKFESKVYKKNPKGITINGGAAYYSFARLTHEYGYGSDIELEQGHLSTGFAGADYGMLASIGDVPLEDVSLESTAAQVLAEHVPASEEPQARIEQRRWMEGETVAGARYARRLPVTANTTYLVRSINYDNSDLLVAFRVVRVDTDQSAVILWKLLKKYPKPNLAQKQAR
jgi:hypothetical protein